MHLILINKKSSANEPPIRSTYLPQLFFQLIKGDIGCGVSSGGQPIQGFADHVW